MIPALNDLRLVETERLLLHEAHDEDRLSLLRERVETDGEQRNPVIVAPHQSRYLVLDGAHRVRILGELGCRFILVQVVEPPETAESWYHLVGADLLPALSEAEGVEISERPGGAAVAEVEQAGGRTVRVRASTPGLEGEVRALWAIGKLYPAGEIVRRVTPEAGVRPEEGETLVRYRPYAPAELVEVVERGAVLPAGITRFRVRERVLGVRFPLEKLRSGDLSRRNAELEEFVRLRWMEDRIRYYGEPVILFE
ncbi:MAG: ParB N-terminal domain-containing protein [Actinomycetota bacterium]